MCIQRQILQVYQHLTFSVISTYCCQFVVYDVFEFIRHERILQSFCELQLLFYWCINDAAFDLFLSLLELHRLAQSSAGLEKDFKVTCGNYFLTGGVKIMREMSRSSGNVPDPRFPHHWDLICLFIDVKKQRSQRFGLTAGKTFFGQLLNFSCSSQQTEMKKLLK